MDLKNILSISKSAFSERIISTIIYKPTTTTRSGDLTRLINVHAYREE